MNREKQIEEMDIVVLANDMHDLNRKRSVLDWFWIAEQLYNAGYRKQSEDSVEVIRCKDCNYCEHCYPTKAKGKEAIEAWRCHFHERYVNPDDFCSFAKMKGGAE